MTPDLHALLAAPESSLLERKPETVNKSELRRTLVAFANTVPEGQTAVLFIGLHDDGSILGVRDTDAVQKRVRETAEQDCYPPIAYTCRVISADGEHVVGVAVSHSPNGPHFSGPAFVRRGSESVVATSEVYEELIHSRTDKCRRILQFRGQLVSVVCVQHVLGKVKVVADVHHKEESECRVLDCDSHTLRLEVINGSSRVAEPLEYVTISYDEIKWRPAAEVVLIKSAVKQMRLARLLAQIESWDPELIAMIARHLLNQNPSLLEDPALVPKRLDATIAALLRWDDESLMKVVDALIRRRPSLRSVL